MDAKQFEAYIDEHKGLVYTLCLSFVKNPYDAEDLAQEAFVSAYRGLAGFDGQNPRAWLAMIAANKCRDFLKSAARRARPTESAELAYIADIAEPPEDLVERAAADERARLLCERLKEPYRAVAVAYFCRDETITEISGRTGENRKTVASRLYRARDQIKMMLEGEV